MKASKASTMVSYLLILSTFILFSHFALAQYKFESTYGGTSSERGTVMSLTNDGGYIICGATSSFSSNQDLYLIKIDQYSKILWSKVYHSPGHIDGFYGVKQTPSGDYYLAGYIEGGFGFLDDLIMKVDSLGNVIWIKIFGGIEADELRDINITPDGGVIVSGQNASFGAGSKEIQVIKFLSNGNIEWAKAYGNIWEEFGAKNLLLSDGNYLIVGDTDISGFYDVRPLLIKTNSSGDIIWAKVYSGFVEDWARSGVQLSDGFMIVGDTRSFGLGGSEDIYLIKTNASGDVQWAKAYGGIDNERGYGVIQNNEGKYVVTGFTKSFGLGGNDAFLMKTDQNGIPEWFYTYGGSSNDYALNVQQTPDSGYVMTGGRSSESLGSEDILLIKTDKDGKSTCENGPFNINVFSVENLQATNYILFTSNVISVSDLTLSTITPNSAQNFICGIIPVELKSFNYQLERNDVVLNWATATETNNMGFKILRDNNGVGFIPGAGTTTEPRKYIFKDENVPSGTFLYSLSQIDYDGTKEIIGEIEVVIVNIPNEYSLQQNYPNPFNPSTKIKFSIPEDGKIVLEVFDALGRKIAELINGEMAVGIYDVQFDASDLPSGIYFYTLRVGNFIAIKKMILLK